jgi:hypothetical protein
MVAVMKPCRGVVARHRGDGAPVLPCAEVGLGVRTRDGVRRWCRMKWPQRFDLVEPRPVASGRVTATAGVVARAAAEGDDDTAAAEVGPGEPNRFCLRG